MKTIKRFIALCLALVLLTTAVYAVDSGAGTMVRRERTLLAPGLEYYRYGYTSNQGTPQAGFALELQQDSPVWPMVVACDTIWGGMTMDEVVAYTEGLGYNVVAAVNTAFFHNPGIPIGLVVENGRLRAAPAEGYAFAVLEDGSYYAVRDPEVTMTLTHETGAVHEIARYNKLPKPDMLMLYSADYSTVSTRVEEDAWAVRLRIAEGSAALNSQMKLEVTEVLPDVQAVPIGEEYLVLTGLKSGSMAEVWRQFAVGQQLTLQFSCADETLSGAVQVSGCGDILVQDGVMTPTETWTASSTAVHPRTLFGWRSDGTLVMLVADGRAPGYSDGISLVQAAEELLRQGCIGGVNMDGGGSSILGMRVPGSYTVEEVNRPSDGQQRSDASFLLLVTDKQPDGEPEYWHLRENNAVVLPGQRVALHAYATDRGFYPAATEQQPLFYSVKYDIFTQPEYIAPSRSGVHRIDMWGGGASGEGQIRVVSQPSDVQITDSRGETPVCVVLRQGEPLDLTVAASYHGVPLYMTKDTVRYEQSAPLGYVDDRGRFVANALRSGMTGVVSVCLGNYRYDLQVTVADSYKDIHRNKIPTALDFYGLVG